MSTADLFFQTYISFLLDVFIIFMWGWGILYALSKITKYKKMLLGAFGCLGMLTYHVYEGLQSIPSELLLMFPNFDKTMQLKNQIIYTWQNIGLADYNISFVLLFQVCIIASLTGRFKLEESSIQKNNANSEIPENKTYDNDFEVQEEHDNSSDHESSEYESIEESEESEEYDSMQDSPEYESENNSSNLEDSEEYIEAYTESQISKEVETYVPVGSISESNASVEIDNDFAEEEVIGDDLSEKTKEMTEEDLADHGKEVPPTWISTPEIQADDLLEEYDEEVAKAETITRDPINIPLEPCGEGSDFTISEKPDATNSSQEEAIPITDTDSSSDLNSTQTSKEIAIPTSPNHDEVEATLACNMNDIIHDDELPGFQYEKDETFANLGNDDKEGTETDPGYDGEGTKTDNPNPQDNKKNGEDDEDDDKRSLLRNLLPTK